MKLEKYCEIINQECILRQESDKEIVQDKEAFKAYAYVKNMYLKEAGDILLYCASLNLLNTYVKQKDSLITYKFKRDLGYLLGIALNVPCDGVSYDFQMDGKNPLLVVQIYSVQFSFHNIPLVKELKQLKAKNNTTLLWDGIRKQKCAVTLWKMTEANDDLCCHETFRGKNLNEKINSLLVNYEFGKLTFNDL